MTPAEKIARAIARSQAEYETAHIVPESAAEREALHAVLDAASPRLYEFADGVTLGQGGCIGFGDAWQVELAPAPSVDADDVRWMLEVGELDEPS